ncbi:MAG: hypothetical protein JG782_1683 [Anaerophaga sp.]|nr:hypothetical protein [Anaerophaga sp.]
MRTFTLLSLIVALTVSFSQSLTAQSPRKIIREAERLIDLELYDDAVSMLIPLTREEHPEALLLKGFALMAQENYPQAVEVLKTAASHYPLDKRNNEEAIEAHYYLARSYRLNEKPDNSLEVFNNLKPHVKDEELLADIEREIQFCKNMKELMANPIAIEIEHLGATLNSKYEDHSPVTLYDESTIYFTSTRPVDSIDSEGPYFENIYVSHWRDNKWTEPTLLEIPGYKGVNRATVGLTPDGRSLIFYQNDRLTGSLFISSKTFDGWSEPQPLPAPVNSGYNETHASFAPDENTIYFSSERPGGYGGKDIYYANRLPDGTWGEPINAGKNINTEWDEEGPFIHPDNKTLYFSSSGHNSMGGYDIFKSTKTEDGWTKAENIGYPVNSAADDVFYVPTPNGQRVYFSSRKEETLGQSDLFLIHFPKNSQQSLAVVASHVFNSENQPAGNATISVTNKTTKEITGTYRVNPATGKFVAIIPAYEKYELNIKCKGYKPYSQTFELGLKDDYKSKERAIYLPPVTLEPEEKGTGQE